MLLPLQFLKFWFWSAPLELLGFFGSLNNAFLQLFSLPLLIKTYFKPWKNEYRKGLIGFSIGMGMFVKTFVIIVDIIILLALLLLEAFFIIGFLAWPFATFFLFDKLPLFTISILYILIIFSIFKKRTPFDFTKSKKSTTEIIKNLLKRKDVQFFLQKGEMDKKEVPLIEISKDSMLKNIKSQITHLDFFVSYLLSIEEQTKLFFKKQLKYKDAESILYWAKSAFPDNANKPFRVSFWGEGIGESWVSGWTLETNKYVIDITKEALSENPMLLGRKKEYDEVVEALSENKSCLLVGEPGSGKSSLVKSLAFKSFVGDMRRNLSHQRFFQLLTDAFLAGAQNQGQLEERLNNVVLEISHSGNVIIFIPNFENILGASTFNTDLSGALIPYMEKGLIRIIANITFGSYKKFVEPKHTLESVFEIIKFEEPDKETALQMLLQMVPEIEKKTKTAITYKAVLASSNFAKKYLQDRVMPGAGVSLLKDTANMVSLSGKKIVEEQDVINKVEEKTKIAIGAPKETEANLLLHLEAELSKYIVGQKEAVFEVAEALRRLRTGLNSKEKPISFLFLGPTGVGKTATAEALSNIYFGGKNKMIRLDMSEYSTEESVKRFLGGLSDSKGLADMVFDNPYSLILLDEFEKSNPKIIDLFLQVFDDGRLTDNTGKTVSFADAIIIATSNAASEYVREEVNKGTIIDKFFQKKLLEFLQEKGIFRPELLNRFDGIVVFEPLKKEEILQITKLMLNDLSKKMLEKDIVVNFDEKIIAKIANEGFDEQFGARPINRFIQNNIEDLLAQKMLKEDIKRGNKVSISVNDANLIIVTVL